MSASDQARPTILQPGEGPRLAGPGSTVKLGGAETGGTLAVILAPVPPGGGPPLHVHAPDDELFLVVEGTISYFCDGAWTDLGPGGVAYFPKGTPHQYRNNGTTLARHWEITTPSGFEHFMRKLTDEIARPGGPSKERILTIHAEHRYTLLEEWPGLPDADD